MMLCLGTLYAWSIFKDPLKEIYGWKDTVLSANFSITMVCYCLGGFLGGKLSGRTSNRVTVLVSGAALLIGFMGASFMPAGSPGAARIMLFVFYGLFSGMGTGLGYNAIVSGIPRWFPEKSGAVTGLLLTAFGIGTLVMGQAANAVIPKIGINAAFRILAVLFIAVMGAGAAIVKIPGAEASRISGVSASGSSGQDYTPGRMLRHPAFWLFFLWNVCMCSSGLMVINSAANIAAAYGAAAILGLLVSVCNGFSRIPLGFMLDKLGQRKTMLFANIMLIVTGALLFAGGYAHITALVFAGMLLMGVCYGSSVTISTSVVRQFYGDKHYAVNLSIVNCCAIPSSFLGPLLSGALIDASGGSYISTFGVILVIALTDMVIGFFVKKPADR